MTNLYRLDSASVKARKQHMDVVNYIDPGNQPYLTFIFYYRPQGLSIDDRFRTWSDCLVFERRDSPGSRNHAPLSYISRCSMF